MVTCILQSFCVQKKLSKISSNSLEKIYFQVVCIFIIGETFDAMFDKKEFYMCLYMFFKMYQNSS